MKTLSKYLLLILVLLMSGCVAWSTNKFYTKDLVVEMPSLYGKWKIYKFSGAKPTKKVITEWEISKSSMVTYDKNNIKSEFDITFFKINGVPLIDVTPKAPKGENEYWIFSVRPMHLLYKVDLKENTLSLKPLNIEWLKKNVTDMSYVTYENDKDSKIYGTSSKNWVKFLTENISKVDMFSSKYEFVLNRAI